MLNVLTAPFRSCNQLRGDNLFGMWPLSQSPRCVKVNGTKLSFSRLKTRDILMRFFCLTCRIQLHFIVCKQICDTCTSKIGLAILLGKLQLVFFRNTQFFFLIEKNITNEYF